MLVRIVGVLFALFALYVLVGEQLVGSSSEAFVNARLAPVRAPISGVVDVSGLQPGDRVAANQQFGNITARRAAAARTSDLRQALALAEADREAFSEPSGYTASTGTGSNPALDRRRAENRVAALADLLDTQLDEQGVELSAALASPAAGIVWSVETYSGQFASEGQDLAHVLDCGSRFVHASVDRGLYNQLSVGDQVQFRPHGGGDPLQATVTVLAGTGPRALLETLAIAPTEAQTRGYTVMLDVPGIDGQACHVGRTGRVIFSDGPLAFLNSLSDWFGR